METYFLKTCFIVIHINNDNPAEKKTFTIINLLKTGMMNGTFIAPYKDVLCF